MGPDIFLTPTRRGGYTQRENRGIVIRRGPFVGDTLIDWASPLITIPAIAWIVKVVAGGVSVSPGFSLRRSTPRSSLSRPCGEVDNIIPRTKLAPMHT